MLSWCSFLVTKIVVFGVKRNSPKLVLQQAMGCLFFKRIRMPVTRLALFVLYFFSISTSAQPELGAPKPLVPNSCESLVAEPYFQYDDFHKKIEANEICLPFTLTACRSGFVQVLRDPTTGHVRVAKHLNETASAGWGGGIKTEINRFRILSHVLNKRSHSFRVVLPKIDQREQNTNIAPTEQILESAFVSGRTVHDLVLDENVSASVREKVKVIFSNYLSDLAKAFHREEEEVLGEAEEVYFAASSRPQLDGLKVFASEQHIWADGRLLNEFLLIKSDNVIVDPYDLEKMTIIDPF